MEEGVRRYFDIVAEEAARPQFQELVREVLRLPDGHQLAAAGPDRSSPAAAALVDRYLAHPARRALDDYFRERLDLRLEQARRDPKAPRFGSIFALDAQGTHLAAAYADRDQTKAVGRYYAWRSYFHGGPQDLPRDTPRERITPIASPHFSAVFRSTTTRGWRVGVSVPLHERGGQPTFLGVLVFSVDVGDFDFLATGGEDRPVGDRFAVLVDARGGQGQGRILSHPYFADSRSVDPAELSGAARPLIEVGLLERMTQDWRLAYRDPLGRAPGGAAYGGTWIAAAQQLHVPASAPEPAGAPGLMVLVQERADGATGPVERLGRRLVTDGVLALVAIAATVGVLWFLALGGRWRRARVAADPAPASPGPRALRDRSTLSEASEHG
jgi:hypothetical protein